MDSKDFRLLAALYEDARQSYLSLGRRVSLSAPVVRERLKRLETRGILMGYSLFLDPSSFGRDELLLFFHKREFTRREVAKALAAPDVAWVGWKLDGGLTLSIWTADGARAAAEVENLLGSKPSGEATTQRRLREPLSLVDLSIIDSLIDDPKMPLKRLLERTGLSPKTVRRHLESLLQSHAISIEPRLGALADSGELVYQLAVAGRIGMDDIRRVMGDAVMIHQTQEPPMRYILCRGNDLGDVTTKTLALSNRPGVGSVDVSLNRELLVSTQFEHMLVQMAIRKSQATHLQ